MDTTIRYNSIPCYDQFIEDCLKPQYKLQWLKSIPFDNEMLKSIILYVAYSDKRLF